MHSIEYCLNWIMYYSFFLLCHHSFCLKKEVRMSVCFSHNRWFVKTRAQIIVLSLIAIGGKIHETDSWKKKTYICVGSITCLFSFSEYHLIQLEYFSIHILCYKVVNNYETTFKNCFIILLLLKFQMKQQTFVV